MKTNNLEVYVHIPFCVKKCAYCDFLSFDDKGNVKEEYVKALQNEIKASRSRNSLESVNVSSIFIGGGTPSSIDGKYIEQILEEIRNNYNVNDNAEITIECNPGTVDKHKAVQYKNIGINRVSMGLQSADDDALRKLGRIHTYEQFLNSYYHIRNSGIKNVNVDLMSGLPSQGLEKYVKSLEKVCKLNPEHISAYSLIIEEDTPFYEKYNENNGTALNELPDEELEREQYYNTKEILKSYGYNRYEISNYSKQGFECVHNCGYWSRIPYIGFGLGASSFINETRYRNTSDMKEYILNSSENTIKEDLQTLSIDEQQEEFMYLGLRMCKGISCAEFERQFKRNIFDVFGNVIEKYKNMEMLKCDGDIIRLTDKGIDVSNIIFSDFLIK